MIRRWLPPDSVTVPPPSRTVRGCALTIFAVWVIAIVTGARPQSNVITPPAATAATTAAEVQPAGEPDPTTRSGCEVSTPRVSTGAAAPPGFAAGVVVRGAGASVPADGSGRAGGRDVVGAGVAAGVGALLVTAGAGARSATGRAGDPQAASAATPARPAASRPTRRTSTAGR